MTDRLTPGMLPAWALEDLSRFFTHDAEVHRQLLVTARMRSEAARREAEAKPDVMAEAHQTIRDYIEDKPAPAADDLVARLREGGTVFEGWPINALIMIDEMHRKACKAADRIEAQAREIAIYRDEVKAANEGILDAYAQRDALKARVRELEAECFELAANQCVVGKGLRLDEFGNTHCPLASDGGDRG